MAEMTETTSSVERPLVTFALFAYNQERFIREAVKGAFSQNYSPMQIILSDDCSSDRTFEIMREVVEEYKGPHEIVLNRNDENLGIGGHVNRVMNMAEGALVVMSAGDDISLPSRTSVLVQEWSLNGFPSGIGSLVAYIDANSDPLPIHESGESGHWMISFSGGMVGPESLWDGPVRTLTGASAAWSLRIWKEFGNLRSEVMTEDSAMSFRASLAGGLCVVPEALVLRRVHGANAWARTVNRPLKNLKQSIEHERDVQRKYRWHAELYRQMIVDLELYSQHSVIGDDLVNFLHNYILTQEKRCSARAQWWELGVISRVRALRYASYGVAKNIIMLFPLRAYCIMMIVVSWLKTVLAGK